MKAIDIHELAFNPFIRFGEDFSLVSAMKPDGTVNTLTAAWGTFGTYWNRSVATVLIRPQRYTKEFIDADDHFTLSFFDSSHESVTEALWYIGRVSGRDEPDKVERAGLHATMVGGYPTFEEASLLLVCRKIYAAPLIEQAFLDDDIIKKHYVKKDFSIQYMGTVEEVWIASNN